MTLRTQLAIGAAVAVIVLPIIIVQAQSEGETEAPPATEVVAQESEPAADPAEQEGTVLGAETDPETASSTEVTEDTVSPDAASTDENVVDATGNESASTTPAEFLTLDTASSTASSTEPVVEAPIEEPWPIEEPFVLQPAVTLQVSGNSIRADIELENLTCKSCEKMLPAAQVKAYYTAWYSNDGPELKEAGERSAQQEIEVTDVALWASRSMTWSAADVAPGRYYFVVVVDPENEIGAYRMHRSEFSI